MKKRKNRPNINVRDWKSWNYLQKIKRHEPNGHAKIESTYDIITKLIQLGGLLNPNLNANHLFFFLLSNQPENNLPTAIEKKEKNRKPATGIADGGFGLLPTNQERTWRSRLPVEGLPHSRHVPPAPPVTWFRGRVLLLFCMDATYFLFSPSFRRRVFFLIFYNNKNINLYSSVKLLLDPQCIYIHIHTFFSG